MAKQKRVFLPGARPKRQAKKKAVKPLTVLRIREIQAHVKRLPDSALRELLGVVEPGMLKEVSKASLPALKTRLSGLKSFLGLYSAAGLARHAKSACVQIESINRRLNELKKTRQ